ncbi:MAG: bifunctional UDP-N-acetylglucosamine diphosphorylase/glucosamine-1-phosphate N-acetyltransferase GlmU [Roseiarcus sp.]|jgi:bifunctional UDP-N-acetylglucosamine pyrophosphorylase/glucosamine-1-phosphate N-acetyltransferase
MTDSDPRRRLAVVLAAGEGVRMKSARPKALHEIAGRSMLAHALGAAIAAGADDLAVVVGPDREDVAAEARRAAPDVAVFVQAERRGTAHAALAARAALARGHDEILIAYADIPLVRPETLAGLFAGLEDGVAVVALGFRARDPAGYGRLVERDGRLVAIVEHRDADVATRALALCNAGPIAISGREALGLLEAIGADNSAHEYYLTDVVAAAVARGLAAATRLASEDEVMGVNDRVQLAAAEAVMQQRLRLRAMREGATLIAPETVFLRHDTRLGRDVIVEPHVVFGDGVTVADGAVIHAFSHLEGATIARDASVGPYARLRPGATIGESAKVGNFVEIKNAAIDAGAKVSHLSYIGDARVGAGANVGAGTITCNYDGFSKFRTEIGEGAFIGSNSALVAPVSIGAGAFVGSGSVVTRDVAPDALALGRGRQVEKPGWAKAFRARQKPKRAGG